MDVESTLTALEASLGDPPAAEDVKTAQNLVWQVFGKEYRPLPLRTKAELSDTELRLARVLAKVRVSATSYVGLPALREDIARFVGDAPSGPADLEIEVGGASVPYWMAIAHVAHGLLDERTTLDAIANTETAAAWHEVVTTFPYSLWQPLAPDADSYKKGIAVRQGDEAWALEHRLRLVSMLVRACPPDAAAQAADALLAASNPSPLSAAVLVEALLATDLDARTVPLLPIALRHPSLGLCEHVLSLFPEERRAELVLLRPIYAAANRGDVIRGKTVEHGWVQFVTPRDCTDLAQRHPSPQITEHILRGIERHAELAASGELKASRRFAPLPEKSLLAYFQAAGAEAVPELEAAQGGAAADFVAKALKKARRKKSKQK